MVQWLRSQAPNAGGLASIPGQGTRPHISHAATKKKKEKKRRRLGDKMFMAALFILSFKRLELAQISEKARATHSSTLAWKIPWAEEPGGLQSMGL